MKIILKGANFADNNIGQIDLPINYIPETLAYLEAIPTTENNLLDSSKKIINKFFKDLIDNNLFGKIDKLFILTFGSIDGAVNLINPTGIKANFPISGITFDHNGITLGTTKWLLSNFARRWDNAHAGFINKIPMTTLAAGKFSHAISSSQNILGLGRRIGSDSTGVLFSSTDRAATKNKEYSTGVILYSKSSNNYTSCSVDGELIVVTEGLALNTSASWNIGSNFSTSADNCQHPIALLTFGSVLTTEELTLYSSLLENLSAVI